MARTAEQKAEKARRRLNRAQRQPGNFQASTSHGALEESVRASKHEETPKHRTFVNLHNGGYAVAK